MHMPTCQSHPTLVWMRCVLFGEGCGVVCCVFHALRVSHHPRNLRRRVGRLAASWKDNGKDESEQA